MKLRDLSDLAFRNLREALLRNSLTTLGVAVGVASLVAMLSLGVGLQQLATSRLAKSGLFDSIFVTPSALRRQTLRHHGRGYAGIFESQRRFRRHARQLFLCAECG